MNRESVEKFIREKATHWYASGNFDRWAALPFLYEAGEAGSELVAAGRRAFDGEVMERPVKLRQVRLGKFEDVAGQTADACAHFDEKKFGGTIELLPHFGELTSEQTPKNGMHIDAGVVISEALRFATTVVTVDRMVEALAHVLGKGDRAKAADALGEERSKRRHAEAAPEARSFWSCCQMS